MHRVELNIFFSSRLILRRSLNEETFDNKDCTSFKEHLKSNYIELLPHNILMQQILYSLYRLAGIGSIHKRFLDQANPSNLHNLPRSESVHIYWLFIACVVSGVLRDFGET